jgi:hypothetical protein
MAGELEIKPNQGDVSERCRIEHRSQSDEIWHDREPSVVNRYRGKQWEKLQKNFPPC